MKKPRRDGTSLLSHEIQLACAHRHGSVIITDDL
eukprot:CAMPEP_0170632602 /NCGR_PEP_ID=MMETSP0224-20130122/35419_1 /TAXON_ID=285029 /ORGANISM="Togula jolla, Strain CCCM 725" /LENGTH=33 /DNA_ID= /DNA_START= /DNA_END= /DNA_ORIENTATION=